MAEKHDYYETLGLSRDASEKEIKTAYRKVALKYHPDRVEEADKKRATEKFKEVTEAYEVLSDSQKRAQYDQFGHSAFQYGNGSAGFGGMEHAEEVFRSFFGEGGGGIFGDIFGDFFGGSSARSSHGSNRGSDLEMSMEISFKEAAFGVEKTIKVPRYERCSACKGQGTAPGTKKISCVQCAGTGQIRQQAGFLSIARACTRCQGQGEIIQTPCPQCRGEGRVKKEKRIEVQVPAGVNTGTRLRVSGEGEAGRGGGAHGDLYILIYVKKDSIFTRDENDILCEVPITFSQAALGDDIDIPTLSGKAKMKIPAGTQSGKVFRFRGKGINDLHGYGKGDELVRIIVEVPTKLDSRQKELLKEFDKSGGGTTPLINSFIDKLKGVFK